MVKKPPRKTMNSGKNAMDEEEEALNMEHDNATQCMQQEIHNNGTLELPQQEIHNNVCVFKSVHATRKLGIRSGKDTTSKVIQSVATDKQLADSGNLQGANTEINIEDSTLRAVDSREVHDSPKSSNDTIKSRNIVDAFTSFQYRHTKGRSTSPNQGSGGMGLTNRFKQLGSLEEDTFGMLRVNTSSYQITTQFPQDTDSIIYENIRRKMKGKKPSGKDQRQDWSKECKWTW